MGQRMARILIIDDENSIIHYLEMLLEKLGYPTRAARSAAEGLQALENENIDIVISDIHLPDRSDPMAWMEQIARCCRQPLLFITGFPDDDIVKKAKEVGAKALLTKPFELAFIKDELSKLADTTYD